MNAAEALSLTAPYPITGNETLVKLQSSLSNKEIIVAGLDSYMNSILFFAVQAGSVSFFSYIKAFIILLLASPIIVILNILTTLSTAIDI